MFKIFVDGIKPTNKTNLHFWVIAILLVLLSYIAVRNAPRKFTKDFYPKDMKVKKKKK